MPRIIPACLRAGLIKNAAQAPPCADARTPRNNTEPTIMLKKLRFAVLLPLSFALILAALIALLVPIINSQLTDIQARAETERLEGLAKNLSAELDAQGRTAVGMALLIANLKTPPRLMAEGDREGLLDITQQAFNAVKDKLGVDQFQFHTPPATSFLRVHQPAKFGDDLSGFRKTVVQVNQTRAPIYGLEHGVAGLGIRGVVPVSHQGQPVGSFEIGMSFGQPFFDNFKKQYGVDVALYLPDGGNFKTFASTLKGASMLGPDALREAMNGKRVYHAVEQDGKTWSVFAQLVKDFSGAPVGVVEVARDASEWQAYMNQVNLLLLGIMGAFLIFGILASIFVSRLLVCPIKQTVNAMNEIAHGNGDLTCRLHEEGRNEMTDLCRAFNAFVSKTHGIMNEVGQATLMVAASAEEMSTITHQSNQAVQRQKQESAQVASAMTEMAASVQEVSGNARHVAEVSGEARELTLSGQREVRAVVEAIHTLSNEITQAATVIRRLEQDSVQVGSVIEVIRSVAEQTNLLALNAAIEAARAGEQGRGFAVVAEEVRSLASRTQQSTQEIQAMIEQLQAQAREAVNVMERSNDHTELSVSKASNAGEALDHITEAVSRIVAMVHEIANTTQQQSQVAEEVSRNIVTIDNEIDQIAESSSQTMVAGDELSRLAAKLNQLVGQFKV